MKFNNVLENVIWVETFFSNRVKLISSKIYISKIMYYPFIHNFCFSLWYWFLKLCYSCQVASQFISSTNWIIHSFLVHLRIHVLFLYIHDDIVVFHYLSFIYSFIHWANRSWVPTVYQMICCKVGIPLQLKQPFNKCKVASVTSAAKERDV